MIFGMDMDSLYLMAHLHPYTDNTVFLKEKLHFDYPCAFEAGILADGRTLGIVLDFDLVSDSTLNLPFDVTCYDSPTYVAAVFTRARTVKHQVYYGAYGSDPFTSSVGFIKEPRLLLHLPLVHCNVNQGEPVDPKVVYHDRPAGVLMQVQGAKLVESRPKTTIGRRDKMAVYTPQPREIYIRTVDSPSFKLHKGLYTDIQYYIQGRKKLVGG